MTRPVEADLRDLEAAAFAEQHRFFGTLLLKRRCMAARRMVVANTCIGLRISTPGCRSGQDLRLLLARRGIGIGLHHHDHDLAARIAGAGDVVLLAVITHSSPTSLAVEMFLASEEATFGSVIA